MDETPERSSRERKMVAGVVMMLAAGALPFIAWFAGQALANRASVPGDPNQNAMFLAFAGLMASCLVALALFVLGLLLLIVGLAERGRAN